MSSNKQRKDSTALSRRDFLRAGAAVSLAAAAAPVTSRAFAAGSDKLRVGLIGCGSRGTGAASNCLNSSPNVELVAMGDLFGDKIDESVRKLQNGEEYVPKVPAETLKVTPETCFVGWDAYKKVLTCDVDMVILATPPHFRPLQFRAAIEADKHVFMEKPVAVDPVGIRSIIASSELARQKGLAVVSGTQRRHQKHYLELMKRVHTGAIGKVRAGQCYWNMGGLWVKKQLPNWSDMEWQIRNWLYFTWLSGDHIVEQHVHNLDVMNWAIGAHPVKCMGMGGRQVRTAPEYGNIFDHFAVEYEYPDGIRVLSMCRQTPGCHSVTAERIIGTTGRLYTDASDGYIEGQNAYKYDGPSPNPYVQEHADLIAGIRNGRVLNEGKRVAESTLTAIMGRMSAYTGRALQWDWAMNASKLELKPPSYEFGKLPVRPVAIPGKTKLV